MPKTLWIMSMSDGLTRFSNTDTGRTFEREGYSYSDARQFTNYLNERALNG